MLSSCMMLHMCVFLFDISKAITMTWSCMYSVVLYLSDECVYENVMYEDPTGNQFY